MIYIYNTDVHSLQKHQTHQTLLSDSGRDRKSSLGTFGKGGTELRKIWRFFDGLKKSDLIHRGS